MLKQGLVRVWGLLVLLLALRYLDISLAHSVECWILNLEAPGSIPAWGELFISTFPLFPVTNVLS